MGRGDIAVVCRPKVTFIPTIELDGDQHYQRDVRRHLKRNLW